MAWFHRRISAGCLGAFRFLLGAAGSIFIGVAIPGAHAVQFQVAGAENRLALENNQGSADFTGPQFSAQLAEGANPDLSFRDFGGTDESGRVSVAASLSAPNDIRLSGYQNFSLTGAPGSTVSLDLQNFILSGHSTLSLLGSSTTTFIFNVSKQFSLPQSGRIVLSGDVQWNHVFFNVLGSGSAVSLSGKSGLFGILTASQRTVRMNGHAIVYGRAFASKLIIRQAAQIIAPPIVSE